MIVTISVCLLAVVFLFLFQNKEKGLKLAFILLGVFVGIRYDFGSDYPAYLNGFEYLKLGYNDYINSFQKNEWLWIFINYVCRPIGFFGLNIVLTIFETYVLYRFVKKYVPKKWYFFAVFLYAFSFEFFLIGTLSMMRQWLAMCFFILASESIIKRMPFTYLLLVAAAVLVHQSAIILTPFYLITYLKSVKITPNKLFLGILLIVLWWFLAPSFVLGRLTSFFGGSSDFELMRRSLKSQASVVALGMGIIGKILMVVICFSQIKYYDERLRILILLYSVSLLFIPLMGLSSLAGRITMYFSIFSLVVIPIVASRLKKKNQFLLMILLIIAFVVNVYDYMTAFSRDEIWNIANYHTIFSTTWQ